VRIRIGLVLFFLLLVLLFLRSLLLFLLLFLFVVFVIKIFNLGNHNIQMLIFKHVLNILKILVAVQAESRTEQGTPVYFIKIVLRIFIVFSMIAMALRRIALWWISGSFTKAPPSPPVRRLPPPWT
jgi:hypothetical protein